MLEATESPTPETADRSAGVSWLRSLEAEVLLGAIGTLRAGGFLTEAEFQAKRQRLAALL